MALTHAITWKGKVWENAYLKITDVLVSDYQKAIIGDDPMNPTYEKKYKVALTTKMYIDSGKEDTIDMHAPWFEYNIYNSGTDIITVDNLNLEDLNYATYYERLKEVPQISDWVDC
jgi:hypothetical protein